MSKKSNILLGLTLLSTTETRPTPSDWTPRQICTGVVLAATALGIGGYCAWKSYKPTTIKPKVITADDYSEHEKDPFTTLYIQLKLTDLNVKAEKTSPLDTSLEVFFRDHWTRPTRLLNATYQGTAFYDFVLATARLHSTKLRQDFDNNQRYAHAHTILNIPKELQALAKASLYKSEYTWDSYKHEFSIGLNDDGIARMCLFSQYQWRKKRTRTR